MTDDQPGSDTRPVDDPVACILDVALAGCAVGALVLLAGIVAGC